MALSIVNLLCGEGEREVQRRCASGSRGLCRGSAVSLPGVRLRCCGAESGCTHAAAKHCDACGDQGDGVRPGSATPVHARLLRSLSQFETSPVLLVLFREQRCCLAAWFLGDVQVGIYSERSPRKEIGIPRRNRRYPGYEQALGWNSAKRSSMTGNSAPVVQCGMLCGKKTGQSRKG